jgi:hypothetical protein
LSITWYIFFSKALGFLVDVPLDYKCKNPIQLAKEQGKTLVGQGHLLAHIKKKI